MISNSCFVGLANSEIEISDSKNAMLGGNTVWSFFFIMNSIALQRAHRYHNRQAMQYPVTRNLILTLKTRLRNPSSHPYPARTMLSEEAEIFSRKSNASFVRKTNGKCRNKYRRNCLRISPKPSRRLRIFDQVPPVSSKLTILPHRLRRSRECGVCV